VWAGVAVGVLVLGASGVWFVVNADATSRRPATARLPPATAPVTRQNLASTEEVDGTLGYGDVHTVVGAAPAVVTQLPVEGATIKRGGRLYRADNAPVVLLYGNLPLYRELRVGTEGAAVRELARNLDALGYDGFTVDDDYSSATATAVRDWQDDLGWEVTGRVSPAQVVVTAGPVRVTELKVQVGSPVAAGRPVLTYTGTTRLVSIDLSVDEQQLARKGARVSVDLPDDKRIAGRIASVGTVARAASPAAGSAAGSAGSTDSGSATIDVTVTLDDPRSAGGLDSAPVRVQLRAQERKNVLTVPVSALLALREGGYGVEVVTGSSSRLVAVKAGLFADGRVEISGAQISEATVVGVAKP
jgi:peptidoglycan hydrolase-like protein with peptidoglycan-binding domain